MVKTKSNLKRFSKILFNLSLFMVILLFINTIITISLIDLRKLKDYEIYTIKDLLYEIQKEYK